jgi:hypothetical protein
VAVGFKLRAQRQSLPPTAAMSTGR